MSYEFVDALVRISVESIRQAFRGSSKIERPLEWLRGFSTPRIRHLLNNLCSHGPCVYLEIGTWAGSTLIPAIFRNDVTAFAIDDYSQLGLDQRGGFDARAELANNLKRYGPFPKLTIWNEDCFQIPPARYPRANVFFYDGNHRAEETFRAITDYGRQCARPFILAVDDLELTPSVREGTMRALAGFKVKQSWELKKQDEFHQGLLLAVVEGPR